jgi:RNA polymerase sigma-70 factor (ECF subfamily)
MNDASMPASFDSISRKLEVQIARYNERVRGAAAQRGIASSDVDEVFQEARVRIWRALRERGDVAEAPATHLQRTALAASVEVIRRRRVRQRERAHVQYQSAPLDTLEDEPAEALERELTALPEDRQLAVRMHLAGYVRSDIAVLMGRSEARTRKLIGRGIAQLRTLLRARGIAEDLL